MIKNLIKQIIRYGSLSNVSYFQSLIKHTIIPFRFINEKISKDSFVLDIGCGEGILANYISKYRKDIFLYGCDLNEKKIEVANKMGNSNCKFDCIDFFELNLENKVDIVIINDMLHHLHYNR